jgi:hypothetical protein
MAAGEVYSFLCIDKMAEQMEPVVALAGGEIYAQHVRSYGIVLSVRKRGLQDKGC